jgi:hypothetical protein
MTRCITYSLCNRYGRSKNLVLVAIPGAADENLVETTLGTLQIISLKGCIKTLGLDGLIVDRVRSART